MKALHVYCTYFQDTYGGAEESIGQICRNTLHHGVESRVNLLKELGIRPDHIIVIM
jgi:hypothetical protein